MFSKFLENLDEIVQNMAHNNLTGNKAHGQEGAIMARYVYSCKSKNGECIGYLESTTEEDKLDMVDDQMAVGFTGNGYLQFWKRCKESELALTEKPYRSVITDTYTGDEKVW